MSDEKERKEIPEYYTRNYLNAYLVKWVLVALLIACIIFALLSIWYINTILLPKFNGLSTDQTRFLEAVLTGSVKK